MTREPQSAAANSLRVVAWNANGGVHQKLTALRRLEPDVAIISECANEDTLRSKSGLEMSDVSMVWVGTPGGKGLGVLGFHGYEVGLDPAFDQRIQWVAPIRVTGHAVFNVLAVWASNHRAREFHPLEPTTGQVIQAMTIYKDFIESAPTIMGGDFNNAVFWDKPGKPTNFSETVAAAGRVGLISAYHRFHDKEFGAEEHPTHYWKTETTDYPFHIDYLFVPSMWAASVVDVAVGSFGDWVSDHSWTGRRLSDHTPVVVDLSVVRSSS